MNLVAKLLMNSLYGKFGMKPEATKVSLYNEDDENDMELLQNIMKLYDESVQDYIKVGKHIIVVRNGLVTYKVDKEDEDFYHGVDVSIAVAAAITSGARIVMSEFKNEPDVDLYYTDTDSIVLNRPLASEYVGSALGQYKLEYEIENAVFLAPKVYGFRTIDGKEIIKIKGVTKDVVKTVTIDDLKKLLIKGSEMFLQQNKWQKSVFSGDISVVETAYMLRATSNKRKPIFVPHYTSEDKILFESMVCTEPYNYSEIEKQYINTPSPT